MTGGGGSEDGGEASFCLSASPLWSQRADKVKLSKTFFFSRTHSLTHTHTPPLCQHLCSLLPTPANYSFTFSWILYQGLPSHYSRQLATAKGQLLHTATPAKGQQLTHGWTLPRGPELRAPKRLCAPNLKITCVFAELRCCYNRFSQDFFRGLGSRD